MRIIGTFHSIFHVHPLKHPYTYTPMSNVESILFVIDLKSAPQNEGIPGYMEMSLGSTNDHDTPLHSLPCLLSQPEQTGYLDMTPGS